MDSQATTDPQVTAEPDPYFDVFLIPRRCTTYPILTLSLCLQYFLYGLYVFLFATYIRIRRRRKTSSTALYFVPMVLLFVLATLLVMVQSIYLPRQAYVKFEAITTRDYDRLFD